VEPGFPSLYQWLAEVERHDRDGRSAAAAIIGNKTGHLYTEEIYLLLREIRYREATRVAPFQLWRAPVEIDLHDPTKSLPY
jgi:hypothetical protein